MKKDLPFPITFFLKVLLALVALPCAWAALGDSCRGANAELVGGTCQPVGDCGAGGGFTISNACPNDPAGIKCCIKKPCTSTAGQAGTCLNNPGSTCAGGTFVTGRCPGPSDVQCCIGASTPGPGPGPAPGPAEEEEDVVVDFWIKAFIPLSVPGITLAYPLDTTKSMIAGIPVIGDCFLTDQRSFDSARAASARMTSVAFIWIDPTQPGDPFTWSQNHYCDESTEVDCEDGAIEDNATQSNDNMSFSLIRGDADAVVLDFRAARNNPLVTPSPDINLVGTLTVDRVNRFVEFVGKVDDFPAFEAYVSINDGEPEIIQQLGPKPGAGPDSLFGDANREFRGRVDF